MRVGLVDVLNWAGLVAFIAAMRLNVLVQRGERLDTSTVVPELLIAMVVATLYVAVASWRMLFGTGFTRLGKDERAQVREALRTGVPHDDPRLRRVEKSLANFLAQPLRIAALQIGVFVTFTVLGYFLLGPWAGRLLAWFVAGAGLLVIGALLGARGDRSSARTLLDAMGEPVTFW